MPKSLIKKPKKGLFRFRPILWVNYGFIVLLLITQLSPFLAPDIFWPMTILAFAFPALVIINIVFVLLWLMLLKRYLLYSLLALILSYSLILDHFQYQKNENTQESENTISLFSFNARNLSNNNAYRGDKMIRNQIVEFVANQSAEIICFQEFQTYPTKGVRAEQDYKAQLALNNMHTTPYLKENTHEFLDLIVLYTKYPILNSYDFYLDGKAYGFYVDLKIEKDTIRLFNLHLESNHFNKSDYHIFTKNETKIDAEKRNKILRLVQKLKKYSVKRSYQARTIKIEMDNSPYPVIVAGDFNDTPASFAFQHISNNMMDAFREKGNGYSNTYNGNLPPMRIDYTLFAKSFNVVDYQVLKPDLSDHYPLLVKFDLKK